MNFYAWRQAWASDIFAHCANRRIFGLLTYMSMAPILQRLVDDGRLCELPSLLTGLETARTMYVTPDIFRVVSEPFADGIEGDRLSEFRQMLDAFSEAGYFSVSERPHSKPFDTMLARVDPVADEFFSIRVITPETTSGIRCLGAFADYDVFVALIWDYRENITDFTDEVAEVKAAWTTLFGAVTPHSGGDIDEYLSNCYPV